MKLSMYSQIILLLRQSELSGTVVDSRTLDHDSGIGGYNKFNLDCKETTPLPRLAEYLLYGAVGISQYEIQFRRNI